MNVFLCFMHFQNTDVYKIFQAPYSNLLYLPQLWHLLVSHTRPVNLVLLKHDLENLLYVIIVEIKKPLVLVAIPEPHLDKLFDRVGWIEVK